jgi:hypothetical protein
MRSNTLCLLTCLLLATLATGCARTVAESSVVDQTSALQDEFEFWDGVEGAHAVTNNDALHGLFLVADGADPHATYDERVAAAKSRRWIPKSWSSPPNESAPVGLMAMAACDIMKVRGGVTMMIIGPTPRYCARELVALGFIPQRTQNQSLSGLEYVDLIRRVERRAPLLPESQPLAPPKLETPTNPAAEESSIQPPPIGSAETKE